MKINISSFIVFLSLATQWTCVVVALQLTRGYKKIFMDFDVQLPAYTILAMHLTRPTLLITIAVITTAIVVAVESLVKSESVRFVVQISNLCFWLILVSYCLIAVWLPFIELCGKLR